MRRVRYALGLTFEIAFIVLVMLAVGFAASWRG